MNIHINGNLLLSHIGAVRNIIHEDAVDYAAIVRRGIYRLSDGKHCGCDLSAPYAGAEGADWISQARSPCISILYAANLLFCFTRGENVFGQCGMWTYVETTVVHLPQVDRFHVLVGVRRSAS